MLNPMVGIGGIVVLLLALAGIYRVGHIDGVAEAKRDAQAALAVSLRRAIDQAAEIARQDAEILSTHTVREASIRVVYRTLNQEANRYALNHRDDPCGLDADGLRLWTAANAGTLAAAPATATPYAALPGSGSAHIGRADGAAGESHRGGEAVSVVPGTTAHAGGVGALGAGAAVME